MSRSTGINSWESWGDDEEDNVEILLAQELDGKVVEINQDQFFKTFLAGKPGALAQECWDALKDPGSESFNDTIESQITAELDALEKEKKHPDASGLGDDATRDAIRDAIRKAIRSRLPTHDGANQEFSLLANVNYEGELYKPLASLLTFINYFYRNYLGDKDGVDEIDKAWPKATQTWSPMDAGSDGASSTEGETPSQDGSTGYLRRRFVVAGTVPRYTRPQDRDLFKPDLALVLQQSEDPWFPDPLGWKDIKVAIEVKRSIETPHLQTARYARCMKLEQFDRNFFFTLTIAGKEFRIARWDSSVCYVTPSLDFHEDPLNFIHVVGRLACMSPKQLGYDQTFSNAGRVLHSESTERNCGIRTILTVTPCEVVEDLQESEEATGEETESPDATPDGDIKESFRYLLDDDLLCDARDLLFCRSTRVWKAWLITESGRLSPPNAIKQNWHDEDRINEAWFYEQTNGIKHGVAHMIHFQDLHRTRRASSLIKSRHVHATWTLASKTILERKQHQGNAPALDNLCHRVLVRFVLKEVGLPLSRIKTPRQLVHVIRDIAIALGALYDRNILHRDISEGNILLSADEDATPGNRAFLTDFGLAMKIDSETKLPLPSSVKHDHMTGTLPFIAIIFHKADEVYMPLSIIHHDVESLFWVGMYMLVKFASCEAFEGMSAKDKKAATLCGEYLNKLRSPDIGTVENQKRVLIRFEEDFQIPGRWSSIQDFLSKIAYVCKGKLRAALAALALSDNPDPLNHDIPTIVSAADVLEGDSSVGLDEHAPAPLPRPSPQPTFQPLGQSERTTSTSTSKKIKRKRTDDEAPFYGRLDGVSGTREHSKRNRKGESSGGGRGI